MGFGKDVADLKAAMKAGMERGQSNADLNAAMKAYVENAGNNGSLVAPVEAMGTPNENDGPKIGEELQAEDKSKQAIDQPAPGQHKSSKGFGRLILFGTIGLLSIFFIMVAFGAIISGQKQRSQLPGHSDQTEIASKLSSGETGPAVSPMVIETPEARLAERIQTYWLPEVEQWPARITDDPATFRDAMAKMDLFNSYLADLPGMKLNAEQTKAVRSYTDALGAKQAGLLPDMRKQYSRQLDAQLFRHDIRVTMHGSGNRMLRLTGVMFARNANIADTQETLYEAATKLRFKRIEYRWSPHISEATYYDLNPPSDSKVTVP